MYDEPMLGVPLHREKSVGLRAQREDLECVWCEVLS